MTNASKTTSDFKQPTPDEIDAIIRDAHRLRAEHMRAAFGGLFARMTKVFAASDIRKAPQGTPATVR